MSRIAIVGAGLIGRSWANVFARSGFDVVVWDPADRVRREAKQQIAVSLGALAAHGLVSDPKLAGERVSISDTLEGAVSGADLVQESGPETLEAKVDLFRHLDAVAQPSTILASSTSAIVASRFTADLAGRHRCLVAHPVNPPHLVPVVELCGAPWTSSETVTRARAIYTAAGQVPVTVEKEIDGFILNRLQVALLTKAFRLVGEGYVSAKDLDHTIADGLGLRWSFMGPFETIELNAPEGIPDYCSRYTAWFQRYMQDLPKPSVWEETNWRKVSDAWGPPMSAGNVAAKSDWRNARLAALRAHKRSIPPFKGSKS